MNAEAQKKNTYENYMCILVQTVPVKFSFSATKTKSGQIQIKIQPHFIKGTISGRFWLWPSIKITKLKSWIWSSLLPESYIFHHCWYPWLIDWLTEWHWVRGLTVLMHLGLIDRPFVPHNLISVQERPGPLLKFQMPPRLKILMSSGSKKGTQI